jgi:hypothetical protein
MLSLAVHTVTTEQTGHIYSFPTHPCWDVDADSPNFPVLYQAGFLIISQHCQFFQKPNVLVVSQ